MCRGSGGRAIRVLRVSRGGLERVAEGNWGKGSASCGSEERAK